jgi:hypothetical protein
MAKELKFMDAPVTDTGKGVLKVAKSDQDKILDSLGVTKDVRKTVAAAENKLAEEAVKFTGEQVLKTKKPVQLELGTGAQKIVYSMGTTNIGRNPRTGEETTSYGRFAIRKRGVVPSTLKAGVLADMQAQIEKSFK